MVSIALAKRQLRLRTGSAFDLIYIRWDQHGIKCFGAEMKLTRYIFGLINITCWHQIPLGRSWRAGIVAKVELEFILLVWILKPGLGGVAYQN